MILSVQQPRRFHRGSAAVEFAVLLPFLVLLGLGAIDLGRFSYAFISVATSARNGAQFGSKSPSAALDTAGIAAAARAEMSSINGFSSSNPSVTSTRIDEGDEGDEEDEGDEGDGDYSVKVTVTFQFSILSKYPLLPQTLPIVRTVHMRIVPL